MFVHPLNILDDISIKMRNSKNDPRIILASNISKVKDDPDCLRSIAIIMAYMQKEKINLLPFLNKLKKEMKLIDKNNLKKHEKQYY